MKKEFDVAKFYQQASDWVINYGPRLIAGLVVLFFGLWLIRWGLDRVRKGLHRKGVDPTVKPFLLSLIGVALRALLIIGVMQIVGVQLTLFTAIIASFGVAAGLALSGTLQNFASGIIILLLKPFTVGDNIITQGLEGTVTAIEVFYTVVTTFDNRVVIVPNGKLSNEVIINISREGRRRLDISLKMPNGVNVKEAKRIINGSIDKEANILATPERRIGVAELQADGYLLSVNVWVNAHGFQDTKLSVQETILQDLIDSGLKLPGV
jgi:small conductance mechanosensitive channel